MHTPVYENYKDYSPPAYVRPTIVKLLSDLPVNGRSGLRSVVLTNSAAVGRGKTHRIAKRKYHLNTCLGFYYPPRRNELPWIEIVVDNVISAYFGPPIPRFFSRISVLRNLAFANTLFHEIGHHLDHTVGAPAPSGEAAAEAWQARLGRSYFRKRYWYLVPFVPLFKELVRRKMEA